MTTTFPSVSEEMPRRLISLKEAAGMVGVDAKTIRNWIHAGQLRGYRLNTRLLRVSQDEVLNLVRPVSDSDGAA